MPSRSTIGAGMLAILAGGAVLGIASTVFAHHSLNHDEGVYLFQAALLLDGSFVWEPGQLQEVLRPWFFVEDGDHLYARYAPVPAGLYALGIAIVGEPRITLATIAAANTFLVYLLGRRVFDGRVGFVASGVYAASPLALVTSSVFLPYAPTTLFTLSFAVAYLRTMETRSRVAAVAAGVAIGLAFFARPFTAVLFALPFIGHAILRVVRAIRRGRYDATVPELLVAGAGTGGVALTLLYNRLVTGAALTFPYEAFAPRDGPGFGTRRILDHVVEYTPELALRANASVLSQFGTRWFTAGALGTLIAIVGLSVAAGQWYRGETVLEGAGETPSAGVLVAALLISVPAGNLLFWGNANILGATPRDGMIGHLGPFYHYDMLAPLAIFAGLALVIGWDWMTRDRHTIEDRRLWSALLIGLVLSATCGGAVGVVAIADPLERNAAHGDDLASVYAPIDSAELDGDDIVFIPRPYGDWQHHPFQYLRNDPDFDGTVYALDRHTASDFAVLDAFPARTPHRFTYRGEWPGSVESTLEELERKQAARFAGQMTVGVPPHVDHAMVGLAESGGDGREYTIESPGDRIAVNWSVTSTGVVLNGAADESAIQLGDHDQLALTITLVQPDGATLTYRQEIDVRSTGDTVEVIWPPRETVCPLTTDCGTDGTYLPGDEDAHRDGVWIERSLTEDADGT